MSEPITPDRKRSRSPGYPSFSLQEAIRRAAALYKHDKRNPVPVAIAAEHWGYSPSSSAVMLSVATLKKFGLLEEVGGGGSRLVKLTDLSLHILLGTEGSSEYRKALQDAALRPQVHAELWEQYGTELPSDANLKRTLVIEKSFNDAAASDLIREYRDTILFADMASSDNMSGNATEETQKEASTMLLESSHLPQMSASPIPQKPQGLKRYAFPLADSPDAELFLPSPLTAENFDLLKAMVQSFLEMSKPALIAKKSNQEPRAVD
ncbi:MAG: hypothetical protein H7144_04110 [Burkholderiales bacterium]|nr:hypothetical protein [Phycisphaerae bacterium]